MIQRSSHRRCSIKIGALRNFARFTRKHLCQSLSNFIKNESLVQVFPCELWEISTNTFFTEHLRVTASGLLKPCLNSDLCFTSKTSGTAFLETPTNPLPVPHRKREKPFPQHFQTHQQHKSLNAYLFLDFELQQRKSKEFNNKRMREQLKRALKSYFFVTKKIKKQTSSVYNFLQPPIQSMSYRLKNG